MTKENLEVNENTCFACMGKGTLVETIDNVTLFNGAIIKNIPAEKCSYCGEIVYDLELLTEIESFIANNAVMDFNKLYKN